MLSIGLVASSRAAMSYFVGDSAGCQADYYVRDGQESGRWVGAGATGLGLTGAVDLEGQEVLRRLLDGYGPTGDALVAPVWRSDPRAQLPAGRLLSAIREAAVVASMPVAMLLDDHRLADRFAALARRRPASRSRPRGVRADVAARMAAASGLDLHSVYDTTGKGRSRLVDRALRRVDAKVDTRRAGYDLTFSAPKSVSVLAAFAPPDVVDQIRAAHAAAIDDALAWLERTTAYAARGHHGDGVTADRIATDGFVAAAFEHGTSRAGDPQLHTHVVVTNLLHGADGRWSALDSRALYRHAKTAGYLYQAALRTQLTERLGLAWLSPQRGVAELDRHDHRVDGLLSKRAAQVKDAMKARGVSGGRAAQAACLDTRPAKDRASSPAELRERWAAEVRAIGVDPDELVAGHFAAAGAGPSREFDRAEVADRLLGPQGLTKHATTFTRDDALQAAAMRLPAGAGSVADVERYVDDLLGSAAVIPADSPSAGWERRWTTQEHLDLEQRAIATAGELRSTPRPGAAPALIEAVLARRSLSPDQADMVRALTSGSTCLQVVVGPAGTGKTAALEAARAIWTHDGTQVFGACLSASAAKQLEQGSGIGSRTVAGMASFLEYSESVGKQPMPDRCVLVVDEAGMVGTRDLERLMRSVRQTSSTIVLVGDAAQLPEIEAGGLFATLAQQPTAELTTNHRQKAAWERQALTMLRAGHVSAALDVYQAAGRIHIADSPERLQWDIAREYMSLSEGDRSVAILAATRREILYINYYVRDLMDSRGLLRGPQLAIRSREGMFGLRAGDRVLVNRNDYGRGLLNGDRGVLTHVSKEAGTAVLVTDDGVRHELSAEWIQQDRLDHAYAMTCHKAQGQTFDVVLVAGSAALTSEAGYVAMSRGRSGSHLYLTREKGQHDQGQDWLHELARAEAERAFAESRRQQMAMELIEDPAIYQGGQTRDMGMNW